LKQLITDAIFVYDFKTATNLSSFRGKFLYCTFFTFYAWQSI